jgi:hypothetical protein
MTIKIDLSGQQFNRLSVVGLFGKTKSGNSLWSCVCTCGKEKVVEDSQLKRGRTKSCGCLRIENSTKHNQAHSGKCTRVYQLWHSIKRRCYNKNFPQYKDYGGRGITVYLEWLDKDYGFETFYAYIGDAPDGMTLDRINNDGNYEPGNIRWATRKEQNNNKRNVKSYEFNGTTATLSQWSVITGIKRKLLFQRINRYHWSVEKAFSTQVINPSKEII